MKTKSAPTAEKLLGIQPDELVFDFEEGRNSRVNGAVHALAPKTLEYLSERGLDSMTRKEKPIDLETCLDALRGVDAEERSATMPKNGKGFDPIYATGHQVSRDLFALMRTMLEKAVDRINSNGS